MTTILPENNSKFAFYGSLRRDMENYYLFHHDFRPIRTAQVQGFKMYSLGDYPYVVKTMNASDRIVVELVEITKDATKQSLHKLELEAGYVCEEIEIAKEKFVIYLFPEAGVNDEPVLEGDWVNFVKQRSF